MRRLDYHSKIVVPVVAQEHIFGALTFVRTSKSNEFDLGDLTLQPNSGAAPDSPLQTRNNFIASNMSPRRCSARFCRGAFPSASGSRAQRALSSGLNRSGHRRRLVRRIRERCRRDRRNDRRRDRQRRRGCAADGPHASSDSRRRARSRDPSEIATHMQSLVACRRWRASRERIYRDHRSGNAPHAIHLGRSRAAVCLRLPTASITRSRRPSAPLGALRDVEFELRHCVLARAVMLVLYTDGVIEVSRDVVEGVRMLERVLSCDATSRTRRNPAEFIERAIAGQTRRATTSPSWPCNFARPRMRWEFEGADSRSAYTMRDEFFAAIATLERSRRERPRGLRTDLRGAHRQRGAPRAGRNLDSLEQRGAADRPACDRRRPGVRLLARAACEPVERKRTRALSDFGAGEESDRRTHSWEGQLYRSRAAGCRRGGRQWGALLRARTRSPGPDGTLCVMAENGMQSITTGIETVPTQPERQATAAATADVEVVFENMTAAQQKRSRRIFSRRPIK